jgi:DNA-directed RNA polymerase subunit M/transcription elongation factor TFIIS
MKLKICPNCKIELIKTKDTPTVKIYKCNECGYERQVESD